MESLLRGVTAAALLGALILAGCSSGTEAAAPSTPAGEPSADADATQATDSPDAAEDQPTPAANADGPHTMRSLAENYVPFQDAWEGPASSSIDITDISRAATIADRTEASAASTTGDDRHVLLSALDFHEARFHACVPLWHMAEEAFGWLPIEATGIVSMNVCTGAGIMPDSNTLLRAPFAADELAGVAETPHDGLFSLGEGEDFEIQQASADRPALWWGPGAPLRIGQSQTDLFFSPSTPQTVAWLEQDPGAVLRSDAAIMAVIDELDTHDVFTAHVAQAVDPMADLRESRAPNRDELIAQRDPRILIRESCDYVAVGAAEVNDVIITYVTYSFADADSAAQAMPSVIDSWSPGALNQDGSQLDVLITEVLDITQREHLVTVTLDVGNGGRWLVADAGQKAPLACLDAEPLAGTTPGGTAGWSDTVQVTVRNTVYDGYTLDLSYSMPRLQTPNFEILDATQLDKYDVVFRIPMTVSVTNTTPGDRPLKLDSFNATFGLYYEYAPDSAVCTAPSEWFTPRRVNLDSGGCRLSVGGVNGYMLTGSDDSIVDLAPGQKYSSHIENEADPSAVFFTPNLQGLSQQQVVDITDALVTPSAVHVAYDPDDSITGIGYSLQVESCKLNEITC